MIELAIYHEQLASLNRVTVRRGPQPAICEKEIVQVSCRCSTRLVKTIQILLK